MSGRVSRVSTRDKDIVPGLGARRLLILFRSVSGFSSSRRGYSHVKECALAPTARDRLALGVAGSSVTRDAPFASRLKTPAPIDEHQNRCPRSSPHLSKRASVRSLGEEVPVRDPFRGSGPGFADDPSSPVASPFLTHAGRSPGRRFPGPGFHRCSSRARFRPPRPGVSERPLFSGCVSESSAARGCVLPLPTYPRTSAFGRWVLRFVRSAASRGDS